MGKNRDVARTEELQAHRVNMRLTYSDDALAMMVIDEIQKWRYCAAPPRLCY